MPMSAALRYQAEMFEVLVSSSSIFHFKAQRAVCCSVSPNHLRVITSQIVFPPGDPETSSQVMDEVQSKERGSSEITQPPAIPIGNIQMLYAFFFFIFFTADEMTFGKKKKKNVKTATGPDGWEPTARMKNPTDLQGKKGRGEGKAKGACRVQQVRHHKSKIITLKHPFTLVFASR